MSTYNYGAHKLQQFKVWNYSPQNKHTYIYIHGGAWRDPNNTFDELSPVANSTPGCTFIGINYRLSPEVKHPFHLVDIAKAMIYILANFKTNEKHLLGYSVGSTLILQFLQFKFHFNEAISYYETYTTDEKNIGNFSDSLVTQELLAYEDEDPVSQLDKLITQGQLYFSSIKFLDGIYDLPELLHEYPDYASFVEEAFPSDKLIKLNSVSNATTRDNYLAFYNYNNIIDANTKIYIVHSLQDELLSLNQTHLLWKFFNETLHSGCIVLTGNWGKHDDIYGEFRKEIFLYKEAK
ncbi:BNA7 [Candida margitis]|uniref:BNA7 n=1 Tax=Candida margitis TaxID=1775924 RepID=UPI002227A1DD|nr:BNA7 [Candida margitis]KAI5967529.1 BNA7 [Candida margitis]